MYNIFKWTFIFVLTIYVVVIVVQRISNNGSVLGYRIFTVASGSMEPEYKVNDIISVKTINVNKLRVGDDIAYIGKRGGVEGLVISHRIIRIDKNENNKVEMLFTKGINSDLEDPSIEPSQVLGRVGGILPIITPLNHIIKNIYGFFFLVFCPLVLVICMEIAEARLAIRLDKEELVKISDLEKVDDKDDDVI
ncbi:MAG: signal peptidase I [Bacilli bacterium]|nr:signal peptidase I [Bacilli bacterium]